MGPTEVVQKFEMQYEDYENVWAKRDETNNYDQMHDKEMLRDEVMPKVEKGLRKTIDEMLDLELNNMRALMGVKAKKGKKKKGKKKKGKKKKNKGPKLPGYKAIAKMTEKEMLVYLVQASIVKRLPATNLSEFLGEFNYIASMMDNPMDQPRPPSMALIRQLVTEYIIFPLGSELIRKRHPEHTMSFLFYGPEGTGKSQMVQAITTETRSILFDLGNSNLTTINERDFAYDKKDSEKMVAMVMCAAKKFGPSVIYLDQCEKIFAGKKKKKKGEKKAKKKGKDEKNPARIKKALMKWRAKWLNDETNITIIGCTSEPQEGSKKDFKKFFKHSLYFPFPDYTTRRHMWRTFIEMEANLMQQGDVPAITDATAA